MATQLSAEQINDLKTKYGEVYHCVGKPQNDVPTWEIVMRRAMRMHYKQWRKAINDPVTKPEAAEMLVRQCVVYPESKDFGELLERWPALCESEAVQKAIVDMTGMESDSSEKG